MRILNISAQKPDGTGSGTFLSQTVASQVAAGHATAVVCGIDNGDSLSALPGPTSVFPVHFMSPDLPFHVCGMSDEMPYAATRYRDLSPSMAAQFEAAFIAAIDRAVLEFKPNVVICHHLYFLASIVREHVNGIPVAAICHATDLRQMAMHDLERKRIIQSIRRMDAVFALHRSQAAEIIEVYGIDPVKVYVTGTGYNARVFNQNGKLEQRVGGRICFVGKISFKKGVESLLSALGMIDPSDLGGLTLEAILVGGHDPSSADYLRIARRAEDCLWPVRLAGRVSTEELVHTYRTSDVFVLPSFYEGLPLVGIEALACGAKVVMTSLPGVREGMESLLPGNPMIWVEPPAMERVDTPDPASLPDFERRLSMAIMQAIREPRADFNVEHASWDMVVSRMLSVLSDGTAA